MALVLDTGPILALLDADDPDHDACVRLIDEIDEDLVVVDPTFVEIDYWIRQRLSPIVWSTFVNDVTAGAYRRESLSTADLNRTVELESQYADLDLGFVDAAVVAVCERLDERKVATLDRRHFSVVRPSHCTAFEILPD